MLAVRAARMQSCEGGACDLDETKVAIWDVQPFGDRAVLIRHRHAELAETALVLRQALAHLMLRPHPHVAAWALGHLCIVLHLRDTRASAAQVAQDITSALPTHLGASHIDATLTSRCVHIPVAYGGEDGPDLSYVAEQHGLTIEQVIHIHTAARYEVHVMGFVPGFAYLSGLPQALATPRRPSPRAQVYKGAVGIGGAQTAVYPAATPGGWQLIGRTPITLFDAHRQPPSLLRVGDEVRFFAVSPASAANWAVSAHGKASAADASPRLAAASACGEIVVIQPGLLTTVQDRGRSGFASDGVAKSGAMDPWAASLANALIGNPADAAMLECSLVGPTLQFQVATEIALTGADMHATLNGVSVPMWTTLPVAAGSTLRLAAATVASRTYVAIAGGIDVPLVMASRSTDVGQGFGGYAGRALQRGDVLQIVPAAKALRPCDETLTEARAGDVASGTHRAMRALVVRQRPQYDTAQIVRIVAPTGVNIASPAAQLEFARVTWQVSTQSNRMGIRLEATGDIASSAAEGDSTRASDPVVPGTIQWPPGGTPIVLMAEAQTVGGYPVAGVVAAADMWKLAQARAGATVRFVFCTVDEAHRAWRAQAVLVRTLL